jgi:ParB-like chromosome segregation protein Spo0J
VKHGGRYWVVDGHNRVGLALYSGQPEIDATITELVAPGERRTEASTNS